MATALDRLLNRKPLTSSRTLPEDPTAGAELFEARVALAASPEDPTAKKLVTKLQSKLVTIRFDLSGIGPERVQKIRDAHPPKKGAKLPGGKRPSVDHDGFTAELLAAVITAVTFSDDPDNPATDLEPGQVAEILKRLSIEDQVDLHVEAIRLDQASTAVDVS